MQRTQSVRKFVIFFENERSQVRTLRVSFQEIARFFVAFGVFDLGWYWLTLKYKKGLSQFGFATVLFVCWLCKLLFTYCPNSAHTHIYFLHLHRISTYRTERIALPSARLPASSTLYQRARGQGSCGTPPRYYRRSRSPRYAKHLQGSRQNGKEEASR